MSNFEKINNFFPQFKTYYLYYLFPICFILGNAAINIFIVIIDLLFIFLSLYNKDHKLSNLFKYSLIILLFIFIKDLINDNTINLKSVFLIRYIFFIEASLYFLNYKVLDKISKFTFLVIIFISIDLVYQSVNTYNFFGMYTGDLNRFSGVFGDEWIIGSFYTKIAFILTPLFFFDKKYRFFYIVYLSSLFLLILISGERIAFATYILLIVLLLIFYKEKNLKLFLKGVIIIFFSTLFLILINYEKINNRYNIETYSKHLNFEIGTQSRLMIYGLKISYDNFLFGVGTNQFKKTCEEYAETKKFFKKCEEHPHNHLIEILVEQGFIVFVVICFFIFKLYYKFFKNIKNYNLIEKMRFLVLLVYFMPFLYSGSIFSTWTATFLSFNLFLVILANRKLNIKI